MNSSASPAAAAWLQLLLGPADPFTGLPLSGSAPVDLTGALHVYPPDSPSPTAYQVSTSLAPVLNLNFSALAPGTTLGLWVASEGVDLAYASAYIQVAYDCSSC